MYHRIDGVWHQLLGKVADCSSPLKACVPLRKLHPLLSQVPVGEPPWRSSLRVELRSTHQALVHLVRVGRLRRYVQGLRLTSVPTRMFRNHWQAGLGAGILCHVQGQARQGTLGFGDSEARQVLDLPWAPTSPEVNPSIIGSVSLPANRDG